MTKVLILFSRTGGGHLRVARTLAEQLTRLDPSCHVSMGDGLELTSFGLRTDPPRDFLLLTTRLIALYNATYAATDRARTVGALRQFIRTLWGRSVRNLIAAEAP